MMRFRGDQALFYLFLLGLMVPLESTVVPLYYDLRDLGLTDTYAALIFPQVGVSVAFGTFWMRAFFRSVPRSLVEAARLDGSSSWSTLWRVVLPVGRPAVLTMMVLVFMWTWNEFLLALVMVSDESLRTAPLGLAFFSGRNTTDFALLAAGSVIVATPVVILYVFLQRHFIRGMLTGAVKGSDGGRAPSRRVSKRFDAVEAVRELTLARRRRVPRAGRAVGLGQDDGAADAGRARVGERRARSGSASAWSTASPRASATSRWSSRTTRCTRR